MDNCPDDHHFPAIVEEVADLLAQHKLVPFFGAGISRQHLGVAAAELAQEMAEQIGYSPETPLADVSDLYVTHELVDGVLSGLSRERPSLLSLRRYERRAEVRRCEQQGKNGKARA